jgi:hypothetical protein
VKWHRKSRPADLLSNPSVAIVENAAKLAVSLKIVNAETEI